MNFTDQLSMQRVTEFNDSVDRFVELRAEQARLEAEILTVLGTIATIIDEVVDAGPMDSKLIEQTERDICIEVGAAARIHDRAMLSMVNNARPFMRDYPNTLEALSQAKISRNHAFIIVDVADSLLTTPKQREIYESLIVPKAKELTTNQLRPVARRIANKLTEKTLDERHKEKATLRDVYVYESGDGMATVVAELPAVAAYAIRDRIGQMALAADPTGRNIAQIRTDIFTDLLLTGYPSGHHANHGLAMGGPGTDQGQEGANQSLDGVGLPRQGAQVGMFGELLVGSDASWSTDAGTDVGSDAGTDADGSVIGTFEPEGGALFSEAQATSDCSECVTTDGSRGLGAIQAQVSITIPLLALLPKNIADIIRQTPGFEQVAGLDGAAELTGYGPIDPRTALYLAGNTSGWDRILVHPISGTPLRTDRYTPSQDIKRTLKTRDVHCRFPGCRMPSSRCDNDHTVPWSEGGTTQIENLAMLCRYHHVFKHRSGWTVTQLENGTLKWTSVLGRTYMTEPPSNEMYRAVPIVPEETDGSPLISGSTDTEANNVSRVGDILPEVIEVYSAPASDPRNSTSAPGVSGAPEFGASGTSRAPEFEATESSKFKATESSEFEASGLSEFEASSASPSPPSSEDDYFAGPPPF